MTGSHGYQVLLLDLDGTVVDYARTEAGALAAIHRAFFRDHVDFLSFTAAFRAVNDDLWAAYRRHQIGLDTLRTERFAWLANELDLPMAAGGLPAVVDRFEQELGRGVRLFTDSLAALRALRCICRLVLVTDGIAAVQRAKLSKARLGAFFEHVVISSEVGYRKPDPALLRHALARSGTGPSGALVVGDSPRSDGAGARAAGIDFCWINRGGAAGTSRSGEDGRGHSGSQDRLAAPARPCFQAPDLATLATWLAGARLPLRPRGLAGSHGQRLGARGGQPAT